MQSCKRVQNIFLVYEKSLFDYKKNVIDLMKKKIPNKLLMLQSEAK